MTLHTIGIRPHRAPLGAGILKVEYADDLAAIRRLRSRRNFHIVLRVPGLALDRASVWEPRLNAALKECGCSLGARCMLVSLAGSIIWAVPLFVMGHSTLVGVFVAWHSSRSCSPGCGRKALGTRASGRPPSGNRKADT